MAYGIFRIYIFTEQVLKIGDSPHRSLYTGRTVFYVQNERSYYGCVSVLFQFDHRGGLTQTRA